MADISNKQPVEGGALLDALSKLLFKGINNIFNEAAEYQKEMGVLKQINKIPAEDGDGNTYNLIVKLSPIKDKDGVYYVELDSDFNGFRPGALHKNTVTLTKKNQKDFLKLVDEVLRNNGLRRIKKEDESSQQEEKESDKFESSKVNEYTEVNDFRFYEYTEDETPYNVHTVLEKSKDGKAVVLKATGDPQLAKSFNYSLSLANESANLGDILEEHLTERCGVYPEDDEEDRWDEFVNYLNNINKPEPEEKPAEEAESEQEPAEASIRVTLEKIIGSDNHEDINLVDITATKYTRRQAMKIVEDIVASDEFVDQMPEGESSYKITEDDEDYDIVQC